MSPECETGKPTTQRGKESTAMIWIFILVTVMASGIAGILYMTWMMGQTDWMKAIAGDKKGMRNLISAGLLLLFFVVFTLTLSFADAVVIFLHILFFSVVYGLIFRIVRKLSGRDYSVNWQGCLALLTAAACLVPGFFFCCHVRKTTYDLSTEKDIDTLCIAMLADSHIGTTFDGDRFAVYLEEIMEQQPDLLLIPGDFVDDSSRRADMLRACEALGDIHPRYGVWFSYGNHDKGYYSGRDFSADELASALEKNNVHILEDETALVGNLCIVGRRDAMWQERAPLNELLKDVGTDKYIIVLDHEPTDYEEEAKTAADLVVSGHTHGGQIIPIGQISEWLKINDRTYGHEKRNHTDFIVTSGISDWAMHFKTGTQSEYVILRVKKSAREDG